MLSHSLSRLGKLALKSKIMFWPVQMAETTQILKARAETASHIWVIEGFSHLDSALGVDVLSKEFTMVDNRWQLELYPGAARTLMNVAL